MTLVAAPERRLADPARERLRRDHARAVEKLLQPVEDAFARAVLRILRAALARVSPALVAAGDQLDLAGLEGLGAAWEREVPELAAQLHDVYGAGVLGAQQQFPQAWARAQAADATAAATMNERALDFLGTASNRLVQVDDAMWGRVRDQLQQGIAAGEGIPQMQTRVRDTLESTELRARTIARTEAVGALNRGSIDGVQSLGGYAPAFKEWLATSDERTRESHLDADGQRVGTDDTFTVGDSQLAYPGDESGPPEETINCRCSLIYTDGPPEGEEPPPPDEGTDTTEEAVAEPEPTVTIEPPPLSPKDEAIADLHTGKDQFDSLWRELRGFAPGDNSPEYVLPAHGDEPYRYENPAEVHVNDYVNVDDRDGKFLVSGTDEGGVRLIDFDTGRLAGHFQYDELELTQRASIPELTDPGGRLEAHTTETVGRRADDEVVRRLEERGITPDNLPGQKELDDLRQRAADLWDERLSVKAQLDEAKLDPAVSREQREAWLEQQRNIDKQRMEVLQRMGDLQASTTTGYRDAYAAEVRDLLDEVRGTGDNFRVRYEVGKGPIQVKRSEVGFADDAARGAANVYPKEWVDTANERGATIMYRGDRGYYIDNGGSGRIQLQAEPGSAYFQEIAVHEFGHRMEYSVDGITDLERQFYERRTEGEELQRLDKLTGSSAYTVNNEMARPDKFADPYMGKEYVGRTDAWELLTMGAQSYLTPEVEVSSFNGWGRAMMEDADYRRWFLGVLFAA